MNHYTIRNKHKSIVCQALDELGVHYVCNGKEYQDDDTVHFEEIMVMLMHTDTPDYTHKEAKAFLRDQDLGIETDYESFDSLYEKIIEQYGF